MPKSAFRYDEKEQVYHCPEGKRLEQAYRTCLGILNLGKRCGPERLEAACRRALHFGVRSWKGVKNILDNRLEEIPLPVATQEELPLGPHENVRGTTYFC